MRFPRRIFYWSYCVALALITCCVGPRVQAQLDSCGTAISQPGDISLQLSLKNGKTVFREGEIIALTAEYRLLLRRSTTRTHVDMTAAGD